MEMLRNASNQHVKRDGLTTKSETLEEWLRAGKELLEPEKELTRRSALAASFQRGPRQ
jgi:predicted dithiol-disulfide oxidoreductase (DUF899 family)